MFSKIKKNYFLIILTFLFLYFFFNLFDGERGLISYLEKKNIMINLDNENEILIEKIEDLEHKNSLEFDNLDLIHDGFGLIGLVGLFTFSGCLVFIFFNNINSIVFFSK